jgi:hypothetical protein
LWLKNSVVAGRQDAKTKKVAIPCGARLRGGPVV